MNDSSNHRPTQPPVIIVPGLGDSGPEHWQSLFEQRLPGCGRVRLNNWDAPHRAEWIEALDQAYLDLGRDVAPVLVAHSLGCATVAHWVKESGRAVRAALFVAPADVDKPHFCRLWPDFRPMPDWPLPFKSVVVASTNDDWVKPDRARLFAERWGSEYLEIGAAGHVSAVDGYGEWPNGWEILQKLLRD